MGAFLSDVMEDPAMRERGKPVQQFASKLPTQVNQWSAVQKALVADGVDEAAVLAEAGPFLCEELGVPKVTVVHADDTAAPDHPKKDAAAPLKPGIALR